MQLTLIRDVWILIIRVNIFPQALFIFTMHNGEPWWKTKVKIMVRYVYKTVSEFSSVIRFVIISLKYFKIEKKNTRDTAGKKLLFNELYLHAESMNWRFQELD